MYIVWAGGGMHPPYPLDPSLGSSTFIVHEFTSIRDINTGLRHDQICRGGGGFNPFSGASQPPKFSLTGLVKNTLLITPLVLPQIENWA